MQKFRVYTYLRASTKEQNAERAQKQLSDFCELKQLKISAHFLENESGATLKRPELFRLLGIADSGDVLLVEQVDRISRLNSADWENLKQLIISKGIKVVSLDLPTSHIFLKQSDEFTERMMNAINNMMLDMLAAVARKDYEDRKRRQQQGIDKAKQSGKYQGKKENTELHNRIARLLEGKHSYSEIIDILNCSRWTVAKVSKRLKENTIK